MNAMTRSFVIAKKFLSEIDCALKPDDNKSATIQLYELRELRKRQKEIWDKWCDQMEVER
jgi:hypothetical protein